MLRPLKTLTNYALQTAETELGKVEQFVIEDETWAVRFFVVRIGKWFKKRDLLLSPLLIHSTDDPNRLLRVNLTQDQLEKSPDIHSTEPVSKLMESKFMDYYHWPRTWTGVGVFGFPPNREGLFGAEDRDAPSDIITPELEAERNNPSRQEGSHSHLWLTSDLWSYEIKELDATEGVFHDLIVDDETWKIRHLAVQIKREETSKLVWVPTEWVESLSWLHHRFQLNLLSETLNYCPEWRSHEPIQLYHEKVLQHYSFVKYAYSKKVS
jgi:hypothetical protein